MTEDEHARELALGGDQAINSRLGQAEAHGIFRQRLERLAGPRGMRPADLPRLARQIRMRTYMPGEIIFPRGVSVDCLGLVIQGQVAVHIGERGADRLAVVLLPGSTFGEAMLVEGRPSKATLAALTRCEIWFLRRADLQALSNERRAERQAAVLRRLVAGSAVLLAVMLLALLVLSLRPARQAVALAPMGVGQWCEQKGYEPCAGQAWKMASSLAPADPNPLVALGSYYFERGDMAEAEEALRAATALSPASAEAYNNLGLIYAHQGEHERAIDSFQEALALEPGIAVTEHNLGRSLHAIHAYDEAIDHYQTALALGEPQTSTLVNLAIAYYETGQSTQAADTAREALLYDDALAPAYTVLGAVALESRQPEEALADLHRAVALDASYGQAYFYLGLAYKSLGQPAEAIIAFERALGLAEDEVMRVRIRRHLNELYGMEKQSRSL